MDAFELAARRLDAELDPKCPGSCARRRRDIKRRLAAANRRSVEPPADDDGVDTAARRPDEESIASLLGQLSGVARLYHMHVIEQATLAAFDGLDHSREWIRGWQHDVFGVAINSGELRMFAVAERNGGGRADHTGPSDDATSAALRLASRYWFKLSRRRPGAGAPPWYQAQNG